MNLAAVIEPHPAAAAALRYEGETTSYGELREQSAAVRTGLAERGVAPGDRVALVVPTTPAFVAGYLGVLGAGAVAVPLNPESPIAELAAELATVRASAVLVGGPRASVLGGPIAGLGYLVLDIGGGGALVAVPVPGGAAPEVPPPAPAGGPAAPLPLVGRSPQDPAVLLFTSGTAGSPKPAVLTHGSLLANLEQMSRVPGLAVTPDDVGILVVPPFHIYGLNAVLGIHLHAGACVVLLERFDAPSLLETVAREGGTVLPGVPQLFAALTACESATGDELGSLRVAISGAAPLALEVAEGFERRFGCRIWQAYGLTEASPSVTFPLVDGPHQPLSVGVPLDGIEVRIVDSDGAPVEADDPGELLVRGPNVFAGYFEDPVATTAALDSDGWLHTGDVGVMDADGSITIVDRDKDLVIVSGFNVYPGEVEHVLEEHPAVAEAVVTGVPDRLLGESVRAFVVPRAEAWPEGEESPSGVTGDELAEFCAERLARYKCPASVVFVRQLPRGSQGKLLRRRLA